MRESVNGTVVEVIKTYDVGYAREVFIKLSDEALKALAVALEIEHNYELADIPPAGTSEFADLLWDDLYQAAVEDIRQSPRVSSFFVVTVTIDDMTEATYLSADWPSAEAFAKKRLALAH